MSLSMCSHRQQQRISSKFENKCSGGLETVIGFVLVHQEDVRRAV